MKRLRSGLEKVCIEHGAVVFGIVSVDDADALKRIKIGSTINKMSIKIRSIMPEAKSVIMFGIASTDDADELTVMRSDISRGYVGWEYPGYYPLHWMQEVVISMLEKEGYQAIKLPELVPHKRLASLAGFGSYGKNSMILSPKYGLWLRFYTVATDADIQKSKPFTKDLCGKCERCIKACPVKAIKPYVLDSFKCLVHQMELEDPPEEFWEYQKKYVPRLTPNTYRMCTVCQKVCPYTTSERRKNTISSASDR